MKYFESTLYVSAHNDDVVKICSTHGLGYNGHCWQARSKEQGYLRQIIEDTRRDLGAFGYTVYRTRLLGVLAEETYREPS